MQDLIDRIDRTARQTASLLESLSDTLKESIVEVARLIAEAHADRGRVVIFGNGGSAADAQHLSAELVGRFLKEREPMDVLALTTNPSTVTCLINDYPADELFARQVRAHISEGDLAIGISTSGNSPNVLAGLLAAKDMGARTVAMTGESGGEAAGIVDVLLNAPSSSTPRIQEVHVLMVHMICEFAEEAVAAGGWKVMAE